MTEHTHRLLRQWMNAHCVDETEIDNLPKLGLMVSHCNTPVGVAFLRHVEGNKGMIDGFLTDPECELDIRTACLDQLILELIELAHKNEMTGIFGLTINKRVVKRALRLGFQLMDHKLVSLNFNCSTWNNLNDG
jgi:hypothetical protein